MFRLAPVAVATFITLALPAAGPLPVVNTPGQSQPEGPQQQLVRLVAPVALYPDPVLTDILAAATYPAQVVEAQRFLADPANAGLQGDALTAAANGHDWDQSVIALLAFPGIVEMMDSRLEWTEQLGHAFVARQADIMGAIQTLRREAQEAGTLSNGPQDTVVNDGSDIAIGPPSQQVVYLPAYDPDCVYGPSPDCTSGQDYVGWDDAVSLPYGYAQWGSLDWADREIHLGHTGSAGFGTQESEAFRGVWRHPSPNLVAGYRQAAFGAHYNTDPAADRPQAFTGAHGRTMPQVHAPILRMTRPPAMMHGGRVGRR